MGDGLSKPYIIWIPAHMPDFWAQKRLTRGSLLHYNIILYRTEFICSGVMVSVDLTKCILFRKTPFTEFQTH